MQHDPASPSFNTNVRQLMHISFKLAAKKRAHYLDLLIQHSNRVGHEVTSNIYDKHLKPLFVS